MSTRIYRFGQEEVEVDEDLDLEDVRMAMAEVFPGLENATAESQEDGSVNFVTRAGTKG